ncbi:MAG: ABC transporter substrate-binding protein [Burkholderiales bacterium]|nr:ABC transporter substrate-binding protein [Burkholderiales bacterium]
MQGSIARCALMLALTLAAPAALARDLAPDALLRAVAVKVIDKINPDREPGAVDPAKVAILVETDIAPLFDFIHMTRLAMARNWHLATAEQQKVLTEEFKTLLVRTYSTALAQYRDEVVEFKPLRAAHMATDVMVRSEVRQAGKVRLTLDYEMEKTPAGWKIYDVKVAGVRLITTYREVFAEKVRDGGIDNLIRFLVARNQDGGSKFNTVKSSFWEKSRLVHAIFQSIFQRGQ